MQPLTILTEDETLFRDSIAGFAASEVKPRVQEMEKAGKIDPTLTKQYFEMGLMGLEVSEAYGGADGSLTMVTIAVEEVSKIDASAAIQLDVQNTLAIYPIATYASAALKKKYLPRLTSDTIGAYALSEPSSGSDAFGLQTRAEQKGDKWILTGRQMWITNGAGAGMFGVLCTASPPAGYKGMTAFIVEKGFPGFAVGKKEDKLGIRASSTCELIMEELRVSKQNVLGEAGKGYKIAIETLNEGRIGIGAQMLGLAQGAWEAAAKYSQERKQFGKSISDFQGIQFQLAQMATEIQAARLMVYNAARMKDAGQNFVKEAAMTKLF